MLSVVPAQGAKESTYTVAFAYIFAGNYDWWML